MTSSIIIFLITQALAIITAFASIYMRITLSLKELEIRVKMVEIQDSHVNKKLDIITEKINELFIELQNKQDR